MHHNSRHKSPLTCDQTDRGGQRRCLGWQCHRARACWSWSQTYRAPGSPSERSLWSVCSCVCACVCVCVRVCVCVCVQPTREQERCDITQLAPHKQQKSEHLAHHDTAGLWRERPPLCRTLLVQGHGNLSNWVHCTHAIHNTSEIK